MSTSDLHKRDLAAQSAKLRRLGAAGSLKLARQGEHARRKYAKGGKIPHEDDEMDAPEGVESKPRLDRPKRSAGGPMGAKGKKGGKEKGSTVNIVIGAKPGAGPMGPGGPMPPLPLPPGPMAGPPGLGPMPPHPPGPPMPMPPGPGAGPPGGASPLPMRKHGGSVKKQADEEHDEEVKLPKGRDGFKKYKRGGMAKC